METSPAKSRAAASSEARLDHTLRILQDRVKEQEAILEEDTQKCIVQSEDDLKQAQKRLEKEKTHLADAKLIQTDLAKRTSSLQGEIDGRTQKSASQASKDMMRDMEKKKTYYDRETSNLVKAFNGFIDDYLAPMLAAEELGGPIVGEMMEVDETVLEAGFSAQGKAKKPKANPDEDKRQRRIDEIWGQRPQSYEGEEEPWDEKRAAAAEMRELTEALLNSLVEAGGIGHGAYVQLTRESAAARFLVRSKIAQFHPRDARKLRLVDFAGEFEE
ncbi:hypothetical protein B0J14DRAFT_478101 [Halenospora varia]|nr:hypothetical protein B0J14DRAFT_478101 [Halenospora varia]